MKRKFFYDPSLVLYLPLYELDGASFASRDAYGHLCTVTPISSGPTWGLQGRTFDGIDDKIDCGQGSALNITGDITIETWIKIPTGAAVDKYLLAKHNGSSGQYSIIIDANAKVLFYLGSSLQGVVALSRDIFYHLLCTRLNGTGSIYINGKLDASGAMNAPSSVSTSLVLGSRNGGTPPYFQHTNGETRIYNRGSTQAEVQHKYLATKWRYQ